MSKATLKFIRLSPNKARLIAREVQGMNAEYALASLEFAPNKAAGIISKVIASAVANGDYEPEEVEVVSCRVDKGPVLRRFKPRARGSASRILKPTSHIMVEVAPAGSETKVEKPVAKETKKVSLSKPLDVLLMYWTVAGNDEGLQFYTDVYNRDGALLKALTTPLANNTI